MIIEIPKQRNAIIFCGLYSYRQWVRFITLFRNNVFLFASAKGSTQSCWVGRERKLRNENNEQFIFVCVYLCGRGRGVRARAGWRVWDLGNGTIMLRKANWDKTLQKSLKFSDCRKSIRKQIRPSCRKIFRPHFVFAWFRASNEI